MDCSRCHTANRVGRRFCLACGEPLTEGCPVCGFANEPDSRFCGGCGGPLPDHRPASVDGERRPVAVLFADLCGYTRLSQTVDPEDMHTLLGAYFDLLDGIVERFGGTVDKHIGDAVMAIFGAPVAHGDDPARAVKAACEMHRSIAGLGERLGRDLAVHIGIASGEVMASGLGSARHRTYTVIGPAVNLASRLVSVAGERETVVDEAVRFAATGWQFLAIDNLDLKGIEGAVAWKVGDALDPSASDHPFVGRGAEIAQLRANLESCRDTGRGTAIYLRGEAGIGKSRLIDELAATAADLGFSAHKGLVLDFGMGTGRDAIREIVAGLLDLEPGSSVEVRLAAALAARAWCDDLFLAEFLDLPMTPSQRSLYEAMDLAARQRGRTEALVGLLRGASSARPRLIVIEDLHWADPATLGYAGVFTNAAPDMPVVVAMTSRIEGDPLDAAWRARAGATLSTVDLGPLRPADARLLADRFGTGSHAFVQRCIEKSAGNPLFLEQLLRARDQEERLPASVQGLVLARMDRLPEDDRAALRVAAVIGQRFSLDVVRHLADLPGYECQALIDHFLVRREGEDLLFGHALIRDGVYSSLTRSRRKTVHKAAAEWFKSRDLALYAEHLDRAEDPDAAVAWLEAARVHAAMLQPERALSLLDRGIVACTNAAVTLAMQLVRGGLLLDAGGGRLAFEAYDAALHLAMDPLDRCRAWLGIAGAKRLTGEIDAAHVALDQAEPLARGSDQEAELEYLRGNLHFSRGNLSACRAAHEELSRGEDAKTWEERATSALADAEHTEAQMRAALAHFRSCAQLSEAGKLRIAIPNRIMIGHCQLYLDGFDAAWGEMDRAVASARAVGDRAAEMLGLESIGLLLYGCGRSRDGRGYLEDAARLAVTLGSRRYAATLLLFQAETDLAEGREEVARARLQAALLIAEDTGIGFLGPAILAILAQPRRPVPAPGPPEVLAEGVAVEPAPQTLLRITSARALADLAERPDDIEARERVRAAEAEAERVAQSGQHARRGSRAADV